MALVLGWLDWRCRLVVPAVRRIGLSKCPGGGGAEQQRSPVRTFIADSGSRDPGAPAANAERGRVSEVERWVLAGHTASGHRIVATDTLEDGTIVDWVARETAVPEGIEPPVLPPEVAAEGELLVDVPPLQGPEGAVPFIRPSFPPYVEGRSSARSVEEYYRSLPSGHPPATPGDRLYGNLSQTVTNFGVSGAVNNYWASTQNPSGQDFVIAELSSWCADANGVVVDQVGVVVGRIPAIYGSGHRIGVESFVGGAGLWVAGAGNGWHNFSGGYTVGQTLGAPSVVDGTQHALSLRIVRAGSGDLWWVYFGTNALGYFDVSERGFTTIANSACIANWYGEAFDDSHATSPWMSADMGSGLFTVAGGKSTNYAKAAYIRLPSYYASAGGNDLTVSSVNAGSTDVFCYDAKVTTDGGSSWNPTLFYGGPGRQGPMCTTDPTCNTGIRNGTACCDPRCETCGGNGCSQRLPAPPYPAGYSASACCIGNINGSGISCTTNRPPCEL
jgi:hypothetical protein